MVRINGFKSSCFVVAALFSSCNLAQAQSSVTLYGLVDGGLLYTSKAGNGGPSSGSTLAMIDGGSAPSQFGLRGTEDLGGGLKTSFTLESGISVANGAFNNSNGNEFGRQAWASLDGGFGDIKVGLQFSPFFMAIYTSDPRGQPQFGSSLMPYLDNVAAAGAFNSNAISYNSPDIHGLQGSVMLGLGGVAGDFQAGRNYSASLQYDIGNFMVNAAMYNGNGGGAATPVLTTVSFEGRTLGVAYKVGQLTAKAAFTNYNVAGAMDNNVYGGGLDYLLATQIDINGGVWVTSDRDNSRNHSVLAALGTNYYLSKSTTLYAQTAFVNNHGAMNTGLALNGAFYGATGTTIGVDIGIRHTF